MKTNGNSETTRRWNPDGGNRAATGLLAGTQRPEAPRARGPEAPGASDGRTATRRRADRRASARAVGRKAGAAAMAVVLAVGLMPLPAFGDDGAVSGVTFNGATFSYEAHYASAAVDADGNVIAESADAYAAGASSAQGNTDAQSLLYAQVAYNNQTRGRSQIDYLAGYSAAGGSLPLSAAITAQEQTVQEQTAQEQAADAGSDSADMAAGTASDETAPANSTLGGDEGPEGEVAVQEADAPAGGSDGDGGAEAAAQDVDLAAGKVDLASPVAYSATAVGAAAAAAVTGNVSVSVNDSGNTTAPPSSTATFAYNVTDTLTVDHAIEGSEEVIYIGANGTSNRYVLNKKPGYSFAYISQGSYDSTSHLSFNGSESGTGRATFSATSNAESLYIHYTAPGGNEVYAYLKGGTLTFYNSSTEPTGGTWQSLTRTDVNTWETENTSRANQRMEGATVSYVDARTNSHVTETGVTAYGNFITYNWYIAPWRYGADLTAIQHVVFAGVIDLPAARDVSYWFRGCTNLVDFEANGMISPRSISSYYAFFYGCTKLERVEMSGACGPYCGSLFNMFYDCSSLKYVDMSGWDTSASQYTANADNKYKMSMRNMFQGCKALETVDMSSFDFSHVRTFVRMFYTCSSLRRIYVADSAAMPSLTATATNNLDKETWSLFYGCTSLVGGMGTAYGSYKVAYGEGGNAEDYAYARIDQGPGSDARGYFTAISQKGAENASSGKSYAVYDDAGTMYFCRSTASVASGDLGKAGQSLTTVTGRALTGYIYQVDESSPTGWSSANPFGTGVPWRVQAENVQRIVFLERIAPVSTSGWFANFCNVNLSAKNVYFFDRLDTSATTDMSGMFWWSHFPTAQNTDSAENKSAVEWLAGMDVSQVRSFSGMFYGLDVRDASGKDVKSILDLSSWDTSSATNMSQMFMGTVGRDCFYVVVSGWDTSSVTDMSYMFAGFQWGTDGKGGSGTAESAWRLVLKNGSDNNQLGRIQLDNFDFSSFDTSMVQSFQGMFRYWSKGGLSNGVDNSPNLSGFSAESATDMSYMFANCGNLYQVRLSGLGESKLTTMESMFANDTNLTSIDLGALDTSKVVNMRNMVLSITNEQFTTLDFSMFDTSSLKYASNMVKANSHLTTIYASEKFVTTNVIEGEKDMLANNASLVGGNGTKWNDAYAGTAYARIDKPGQAGFLTAIGDTKAYAVLQNGTLYFMRSKSAPTGNSVTSLGGITYTGTVYQGFESLTTNNKTNVPWDADRASVTSVVTVDEIHPSGTAYWFASMGKLESADLGKLDTSKAIEFTGMFQFCYMLGSVNVSAFNTSYVTSMRYMFQGCQNIESLDLSSWDTSNCNDMAYMFSKCFSLRRVDVSTWDTSHVVDMAGMFGCTNPTSKEQDETTPYAIDPKTGNKRTENDRGALEELDLTKWDTSCVASMSNMFAYQGIERLDLSSFDTDRVTNFSSMFNESYNLSDLVLSTSFTTRNATSLGYMFHKCLGLTKLNLSSFDTAKVTNMERMFGNCNYLVSLDLSSFDTSNVTNMNGMFRNCSALTTIYASSSFVTTKVSDPTTVDMFFNCRVLQGGSGTKALTVAGGTGYTNLNTSKHPSIQAAYARIDGGTSAPGYFTATTGATPVALQIGNTFVVISTMTDMSSYKRGNSVTLTGLNGATYTGRYFGVQYSPPTETEAGGSATGLIGGLASATWSSITEVRIETKITLAENSSGLFRGGTSLVSIKGLENLDTSSVTSLYAAFSGCSSLTELDLSWFRTSKVTNFGNMFNGCTSLRTIYASESFALSSAATPTDNTVFLGCNALVGGHGTSTASGQATLARAVPDMLGRPGLFTLRTHSNAYAVYNDGTLTFFRSFVSGATSAAAAIPSDGHAAYSGTLYANVESTPEAESGQLWSGNRESIAKVVYSDPVRPASMAFWYDHCSKLTTFDSSYNLDSSTVRTFFRTFAECTSLKSFDASLLDTSSAYTFEGMFFRCEQLAMLDVSGFQTGRAISMCRMFAHCYKLEALDVSGFNTSSCTSMQEMFYDVNKSDSVVNKHFALDTSSFDTSNVLTFENVFGNMSHLVYVDVSGFDTSHAVNMSGMFQGCEALASLNLSSFNTSSATSMESMFHLCRSLTSVDVSSFDTSNVVMFKTMFANCGLKTILASESFVTSASDATNSVSMFAGSGNIVGGNGTSMSAKYQADTSTDKVTSTNFTYAKIDKAGQEGYFTGVGSVLGEKVYAVYNNKTVTICKGKLSNKTVTGSYATYTGTSVVEVDIENGYKSANVSNTDASLNNPMAALNDATKVVIADRIAPTKMNYWFAGWKEVTTFEGLEKLDMSHCVSLARAFWNCNKATMFNVGSWDVSNCTTMESVFRDCFAATFTGLEGWDVSSCTSMHYALSACQAIQSLDLSRWDVSHVGSFNGTFWNCLNMKSLDLSGWNTSSATTMAGMFSKCQALQSLDVSSFDTSNVTSMSNMFYRCFPLTTLDLSSFDTRKVTDMHAMFAECYSLKSVNLSSFNTSNVTNMRGMFWCQASAVGHLEYLDLSGFNTSKVTDMCGMFENQRSLAMLDISGFDTSKVYDMKNMFNNAIKLATIYGPASFSTANVGKRAADAKLGDETIGAGSTTAMFYGLNAIKGGSGTAYNSTAAVYDAATYARIDGGTSAPGYFTGNSGTVAAVVQSSGEMVMLRGKLTSGSFGSASSTSQFKHASTGTVYTGTVYQVNLTDAAPGSGWPVWNDSRSAVKKVTILDVITPQGTRAWFRQMENLESIAGLEKLNMSKCQTMQYMFLSSAKLSGSLDLSMWDVSSCENFRGMFSGCQSLDAVDLSGWNAPLVKSGAFANGQQEDSKETKGLSAMFNDCKTLASVDLSNASFANCSNADLMFNGCASLTSLNLTGFSLPKVANAASMFKGCSSLTSLDLASLSFSNTTNMEAMFMNCSSLTSLDLSKFSTANVTSMASLFENCYSLSSVNLSSFNTKKVTTMKQMFRKCYSLRELDLLSFDTAALVNTYLMFGDCTSLTTIYATSSFTTSKITETGQDTSSSAGMFDGASLLKGGYGTSQGSDYLNVSTITADARKNKTYARLDGGEDAPGYFSSREKGGAYAVLDAAGTTLTFIRSAHDYQTGDAKAVSTANTTYAGTVYAGVESQTYTKAADVPWAKAAKNVTSVVFAQKVYPQSTAYWFANMARLSAQPDLANLDTSKTRDMSCMFSGCSHLASLDLSGLDTSQSTSFFKMLDGCSGLKSLNLGSVSTAKAANLSGMFSGCSALASVTFGGAFTFKGTATSAGYYALLPTPPADGEHLGTWVISGQKSSTSKTPEAMQALTGEQLAGTWVWADADTVVVKYYSAASNTGDAALIGQSELSADADDNLAFKSALSSGNAPSGYTFYGWALADKSTSRAYADAGAVPAGTYKAGATVSLYAIYQKNVTFTMLTGSGTKQTPKSTLIYNHGISAVGLPSTAHMSSNGWSLEGWRTDNANTASGYVTTSGGYIYNRTDANYYAVYTRSVSLTFNANGGSGSAPTYSQTQTQTINAGQTSPTAVTFTNMPENKYTKNNYVFNGWAYANTAASGTDKGASLAANTPAVNASNKLNVYATWAGTYTINYFNNTTGTTPTKTATSRLDADYTLLAASNFTAPEGYTTLEHWASSATSSDLAYAAGAKIAKGTQKTVGAVVNVYAVWEGSMTLHTGYNTDVTTVKQLYYGAGSKTASLPALTMPAADKGWQPVGWVATASGTDVEAANCMAHTESAAKTYTGTAKELWQRFTRTVSISWSKASTKPGAATGGTDPAAKSAAQTLNSKGTVTQVSFTSMPACNYTLANYTFNGWSTSNAATSGTAQGGTLTANPAYNAANSVTVYPTWMGVYSIEYYSVNSAAKKTETGLRIDQAHTLLDTTSANNLASPDSNRWTFAGWSTGTNTTKAHDNKASIAANAQKAGDTVKLYAIWKGSLKLNRGTSATTTVDQYYYGTGSYTAAIAANTMTLPATDKGWGCVGWVANKADTSVALSHANAAAAATYNGSAAELWARYSRTVTVAWSNASTKPSAATGSAPTTKPTGTQFYNAGQTPEAFSTSALPANTYTLSGYHFNGWSTSNVATSGTAANSALSVAAGTPAVGSAASVSVYPTWAGNQYTVKFYNASDTTSIGEQSFTYGTAQKLTSASTLKATADGYEFEYWSNAKTGGTTVADQASISAAIAGTTPEHNATVSLYARFKKDVKLYSGLEGTTLQKTLTGHYNPLAATKYTVQLEAPTAVQDWSIAGWRSNKDAAASQFGGTDTVSDTSDAFYAVYSRKATFYTSTISGSTWSSATDKTIDQYACGGKYAVAAPQVTSPASGSWIPLGWATSADTLTGSGLLGTQASAKSPLPSATLSSSSNAFYCVYQRTLTMSYDANGGSGTVGNTTVTQYHNASAKDKVSNPNLTLSNTVFTAPTGRSFSKWAVGSTSGTQYDRNKAVAVGTLGFSTDAAGTVVSRTAYAIWGANTYTVKYVLNGGTLTGKADGSTDTATYGSALSVAKPTQADWTFLGWRITGMDKTTHKLGSADSTAESVLASTETSFTNLRAIEGVVTFEAQWGKVARAGWTYDGKAHEPTAEVKGGSWSSETPAFSYMVTTQVNNFIDGSPSAAGTYLSRATWTSKEVLGTVVLDTAPYTISKRPIAFTGKSNADATYNGKEQSVTGYDTGGQGLLSGHTATLEASAKGTLPGTHQGTITAKDKVVIKSGTTDVTSNYDITTTPGSIIIKAAGELVLGSGSQTWTYDAAGHQNTDFTVKFGEKTATATKDAGAATYSVAVPDTGDKVTFTPATTVSGYTAGTPNDFNYTVANASGYSKVTKSAGTLKVDKRELTVTAQTKTVTYGAAPGTLTVSYSGWATGEDSTVLTKAPAATTAYSQYGDVGTYATKASGGEAANYSFKYVDGELTVSPKAATVTTDTASKQYDGTALTSATASIEGLVGTDAATVTTTGSQTEVGTSDNTYTISFTKGKAGNYTISDNLGKLTVEKNSGAVKLTAASGEKVYDGTPLTDAGVTATGLPAGFTVAASASGSQTNAGSSANAVADGYVIKNASGEDKTANFTNVTKAEGTLKVTAKPITITAKAQTITYGQTIATGTDQATAATLAPGDSLSAVTLTPSTGQATQDGTITPSAAKVVRGSTDVTSNYDITYAGGKLVINKAASSVKTAPTARSLTYNAGDQALVNAGEGRDGTIRYKLGDGSWGADVPTGKAAGDYTVYYKVAGDSNHYDTAEQSVKVTIGQKALTVTAKPKAIIYGDVPANDGVTYSGFASGESEQAGKSDLSGSLSYVYSYAQYGDVGEYTITPSGLSSSNYKIGYAAGKLTVDPKPYTVTTDSASREYDGTALTAGVSVGGLVNGETATVTATGSQTHAGTSQNGYELSWTGTAKESNYQLQSESLGSLTVSKRPVSLSLDVQHPSEAAGNGNYPWTGVAEAVKVATAYAGDDTAQSAKGGVVEADAFDSADPGKSSNAVRALLRLSGAAAGQAGSHTATLLFLGASDDYTVKLAGGTEPNVLGTLASASWTVSQRSIDAASPKANATELSLLTDSVPSADTVLGEGEDYRVLGFYQDESLTKRVGSAWPEEPGEYFAKVAGKGNYTGTRAVKVMVGADDLSDSSMFSLSAANDGAPFSGAPVAPQATVKNLANDSSIDSTAYALAVYAAGESSPCAVYEGGALVSGEAPSEPGTYSLRAYGVGSAGYRGVAQAEFAIAQANLSSASISVEDLTYRAGLVPAPVMVGSLGSYALELGRDVSVAYSFPAPGGSGTQTGLENLYEPVSDGGYTVTATYTALAGGPFVAGTTKTATFTVKPAASDLSRGAVVVDSSQQLARDASGAFYATGQALTPAVRVYALASVLTGDALRLGRDYLLAYSHNVSPGRAAVTAVGVGSYKGKATASFRIVARPSAALATPTTAAEAAAAGSVRASGSPAAVSVQGTSSEPGALEAAQVTLSTQPAQGLDASSSGQTGIVAGKEQVEPVNAIGEEQEMSTPLQAAKSSLAASVAAGASVASSAAAALFAALDASASGGEGSVAESAACAVFAALDDGA